MLIIFKYHTFLLLKKLKNPELLEIEQSISKISKIYFIIVTIKKEKNIYLFMLIYSIIKQQFN